MYIYIYYYTNIIHGSDLLQPFRRISWLSAPSPTRPSGVGIYHVPSNVCVWPEVHGHVTMLTVYKANTTLASLLARVCSCTRVVYPHYIILCTKDKSLRRRYIVNKRRKTSVCSSPTPPPPPSRVLVLTRLLFSDVSFFDPPLPPTPRARAFMSSILRDTTDCVHSTLARTLYCIVFVYTAAVRVRCIRIIKYNTTCITSYNRCENNNPVYIRIALWAVNLRFSFHWKSRR